MSEQRKPESGDNQHILKSPLHDSNQRLQFTWREGDKISEDSELQKATRGTQLQCCEDIRIKGIRDKGTPREKPE